MYQVTAFLWFILPYLLLAIATCLVSLNVYLFTQGSQYQRGRRAGYRAGKIAGQRKGYERGRVAGLADGEAAGREAEYLEHQHFVLCPEDGCDKAIHVPCHVIIEGEPGHQEIRAEVDQTQLALHMHTHTGLWPGDAPAHEGGHQ